MKLRGLVPTFKGCGPFCLPRCAGAIRTCGVVSPAAVGAVGVPGVAVTTGISSPIIKKKIKFELIEQWIQIKGLGIHSKNVSGGLPFPQNI
jgi:hypothetical protein